MFTSSCARRGLHILILLLAVGASGGCATRYYKTPSVVSVAPRTGFLHGTDVLVGVFDGRANPAFTPELAASVREVVQRAYPDANVLAVDYWADPQEVAVTILVKVEFLESGFTSQIATAYGRSYGGSGSAFAMASKADWTGVARLNVDVVDWRDSNQVKHSFTVENMASQPNLWGYTTAKAVLDEAWAKSVGEMCSNLDRTLQ